MGPYNWRGGLRLDLWVHEMTWKEWIARTTRAYRREIYKAYAAGWLLCGTPEFKPLPPLVPSS